MGNARKKTRAANRRLKGRGGCSARNEQNVIKQQKQNNMINKLFRKHASVIPTGAPTLRSGQAARTGGIPSFRRFLATLGMTALLYWSATAQNGVTVTGLNVAAGTVTFNVSWRNTGMPTLWNDSVWVFVDYNKNGVMTRLPVISATATAGTVEKISGNDQGVRVIGNARSAGSFSATVWLFTDITDIVGACAYASNYPPVGGYASAEEMVFTGTPPYEVEVKDAGGYPRTLQSGSTFMVPASRVVTSFSDKTGAPGACIPMLGELGFSMSPNDVVREQPATFTVTSSLQAPAAFAVTYHWSAPGFGTTAGTGSSFSATAPATASTHTVTLTAKAAGHCDKVVKQGVTVQNCGTLSAPTDASANARCGGGTVTFSATPPNGCTIDWYDASNGGSIVLGGTGTASFSPTINSTTTYYAQARNTITGCVSAGRTAVVATVNTVPVITRTGGDASQTVYQNSDITAIVYSAPNSAFTSSGSLPPGVTGSATATSYTISGTPSASGTYNYTVAASYSTGGCTATSSGTITVYPAPTTPPGAMSTNTWTIGTQIWSDALQHAPNDCVNTQDSGTSTQPTYAYIRTTNLVQGSGYMYNWLCMMNNASALCPDPWRLPSADDFCTLLRSIMDDPDSPCQSINDADVLTAIFATSGTNAWGARSSGTWYGTTLHWPARSTYMSSDLDGDQILIFDAYPGLAVTAATKTFNASGTQVRCVR
jgi:uncharacterized protein (TIGR02145 family)